jgi:hypothetical protein
MVPNKRNCFGKDQVASGVCVVMSHLARLRIMVLFIVSLFSWTCSCFLHATCIKIPVSGDQVLPQWLTAIRRMSCDLIKSEVWYNKTLAYPHEIFWQSQGRKYIIHHCLLFPFKFHPDLLWTFVQIF